MEEQEPWHLTIVLLEGLRLMRPEKAWRPIVTVEVDKHHAHETTLGVDGQCVNQKEVFKFHDATPASKVEVSVWHRSQSKKKKRKILVASASHCLGELVKKQETEPRLEIRLQCRTADRSCTSSRGRPQKGAIIRLKIKPPTSIDCAQAPARMDEQEAVRPKLPWQDSGSSADDTDDSCSVDTDRNPLEDTPLLAPQPRQHGLRRRKVRGYLIDSDDQDDLFDSDGESIDDLEAETRLLLSHSNNSTTCVDEDEYSKALVYRSGTGEIIKFSGDDGEWVAMMADVGLLPQYSEKITAPPSAQLRRVERILASMTMYGELASAVTEDEFEPVFRRLQQEWTFIGGLLVALAAVDTAVFSISPGSIFNVDSWAKGAIATSSIASGLGIACDAWFLLRYNWADLKTFITRSRDLYNSYFFFSLSARVPALCMFISSISLMAFLGLVAFDAWPSGVLAVCFIVGILMSLQFLAYGAHWCASTVLQGGRAGTRHVGHLVRKMTATSSA